MERTLIAMSHIQYKDTALTPLIGEKIIAAMKGRDHDGFTGPDPEKAIFGGKVGFEEKFYVYKQFEKSQEYLDHVNTILEWETEIQKETQEPQTEVEEINDLFERITKVSTQ